MEYVYLIILVALIEYLVFGALVGRARGIHGVKAPAITGNAAFERAHRVHQNTLENLVVFVPACWIFGSLVSSLWAALLGLVFVIGRAVYAAGYYAAAEKRSLGFGISFIANAALILGGLIGLLGTLI
jgi:glutathione S-transferase